MEIFPSRNINPGTTHSYRYRKMFLVLINVIPLRRNLDANRAVWSQKNIYKSPRAIIISALGRIRGLEPWEYKHPGEDFEFSGIRSTLYILGLIAVVFFISWHFARAYATLVGTLFISGGKGEGIKKPEVNLHAAYTGSRAVLVLWGILFTCFLIVEDDGFDYRGALLAWVLSLLAVFPVPVSLMWLGITTGIFIQGIGANRLRFLGCDP